MDYVACFLFQFDFGKFLAEVFDEEVPDTKEINVVAPTFFSKLGMLIENTETRLVPLCFSAKTYFYYYLTK